MNGRYDRALYAFRVGDYATCAKVARSMLESGASHEVFQVLLISMQRMGLAEAADRMGEKLVAAAGDRPVPRLLLGVTLGQVEGETAVAELAGDPETLCQAHFYWGARLVTLEQVAGARRALDACLAIDCDVVERVVLGQAERDRLPRTRDESVLLGAHRRAERLLESAVPLAVNGKLDQAAVLTRRALEIARGESVEDEELVLRALQSLGSLHLRLRDPAAALELFEEQLEVSESLHGDDSPETARAASNRAVALSDLGRHGEAEPDLARTVEIHMERFGTADARTATSVGNLALNLRRQGRFEESGQEYHKAYMMKQMVYGPAHPESVAVLGHWVEMLEEAGSVEEAEGIRRMMRGLGGMGGPD